MPRDEEAIKQFLMSAIRSMADYTLPYLASVIGVDDPKKGKHIGSAFRCTLSDRRCLVTAWHVIERALNDYPDFAISAGFGVPPFLAQGRIHYDRIADLAICLLPDDYPEAREGLAYWPEGRIEVATARLATDYLFAHGFPGQRSYPSSLLGGVVSKSLPYGAMQKLDDLPSDFAPYQFALHFDTQHLFDSLGPADELPDPHGMSGSPVWRIGASGHSMKEWTPDRSLLAGVLTDWPQQSVMLVATQAEKLLELRDCVV